MAETFVNINHYFDTSAGIHQYAIGAITPDGIRKQVNDFYLKLYNHGGRVIEEKRTRRNGVTHIVFTYEI